MRKIIGVTLFLLIFSLTNALAQYGNGQIKKSLVLFTQPGGESEANYGHFNADGLHWGFMLGQGIDNDTEMNNWAQGVENRRANDRYFFGRGEYDWGWKWMIDYMGNNVDDYWAKDLNGNNINWSTAAHKGVTHGWQSHQGPLFTEFLKHQVDRMTMAPISHMMFDSQTSATRTLHWKGGDFSSPSMDGFREYMRNKYTTQELSNKGITNIDNFNYRQFLLNAGIDLQTYKNRAGRINGNIPLYEDFVYFQRQALNDVMDNVFDYVDTKRPGIPIGATTNLVEPRGFIFSDRLTYLAGEFPHDYDPNASPPTQMVLHYKLAEDLNKTLIFFPYPDAFNDLQNRNAPRQSRGWIAQSYAMGSIFTIPGKVWTNNANGNWDMGHENHADLYTFVKNHSELFDDYKALSNVALTYSVYASLLEGGMNGSGTSRTTLDALIKDNISFDMKIFGDPDRPLMPSNDELIAYDVIVQDNDKQYFTNAQTQLLNNQGAHVIDYTANSLANIRSQLSWKLEVLQNGTINNGIISTLPRTSTIDPSAPYVIHLINRDYDQSIDNAKTHNNVSVKIPTNMFDKMITEAQLHIPGQASVTLALNTNIDGEITVNLGTFSSCWGLLELTHQTVMTDDVTITNKPSELISDTNYTFDIGYTATTDRDVVVSIFNDGVWIAGVTQTVNAGTSTLIAEFTFENPLPVGNNYEVRAMIREVGGDYTTNIDLDIAIPVSVVYKERVAVIDPPSHLPSTNTFIFDVSYTANESVDLLVQILDMNDNWIGGTKVTILAGQNIETVTIDLNAPLPAENTYEIRSMIRPIDGSFSTNLAIERILDVEVQVITGISENNSESLVFTYPNPTTTILYLKGLLEGNEWTLFNLRSEIIKKGIDTKINLTGLPSGIYFLDFVSGQKVKFIKL